MYQIEYIEEQENAIYEEIIKKVIKKCFEVENLLDSQLYISITVTNPKNIHKINKEYRNVYKPTDVLSFPMFEKEEIDKKIKERTIMRKKEENILNSLEITRI